MKPTVGRIVHFVPNNGNTEHQAAIVVNMHSDICVSLWVFGSDGGCYSASSVTEDKTGLKEYSWHWPEREDNDL